jgi:hypothetical protein
VAKKSGTSAIIRFRFQGKVHDLDLDKVPNSRKVKIRQFTGGYLNAGLGKLIHHLGDGDPDAFTAVLWLHLSRQDKKLSWVKVQRLLDEADFELVDFIIDGESMMESDDEDTPDEDQADGDDGPPPSGTSSTD